MSGGSQYGSIVIDVGHPDDDGGGDSVRGGGSNGPVLTHQCEMVLRPCLTIQRGQCADLTSGCSNRKAV